MEPGPGFFPRFPLSNRLQIDYLTPYFFQCIVEDHPGLLVGTAGGGLNIFDTQTEIFTRCQHDPNNPTSLSHNYIPVIYKDREGGIWIGTWGGGLNQLDKQEKAFSHYQASTDDPYSLSDNDVFSLCEDRAGNLWIGTSGGGLNRFDRENKRFIHYTTRDGLPNNIINGILEDSQGCLWLSTNRGISRFNPSTKVFKNYDLRAGIQGQKFNLGAYYKNQTGEMFFGGVNGLNSFYPDRITGNLNIPPVVITHFKRFNQPVTIGGDSPLQKHISYTSELTLSYRENFFSLEFAALDYTNPSQNQYKYKMEGLHNDWVYLGTKHDVNFAGLPPGEYIFRVKGSNSDGTWNEEGTSLKVIITPPFWAAWWFRGLCVILAAALIYLWHQSRLKRLTLQLKTETELERIFRKYNISNREQEIIQLILKGKSNKEIEDSLYISLPTVKSHIYSVYRKLGVKNRLELINFIQKTIKPG